MKKKKPHLERFLEELSLQHKLKYSQGAIILLYEA